MITVVIPTSPIPSHPSTRILDETIKSVRHHLSDSEIILTFDGVREEQQGKKEDYDEFTRKVLAKCLHSKAYSNVLPLLFDQHTHQVGMARKALEYVTTPLLLYVEADAPLVTDEPIDWKGISRLVLDGHADMVRLHFETVIPEPHAHLMYDASPIRIAGVPVIRTAQYSQRPHVASVAFYRRLLADHFSPDAKCFIEDRLHGVVSEANKIDGIQGWNQYRLMIYAPKGNYRRSYHSDGRQGGEKFDGAMTF